MTIQRLSTRDVTVLENPGKRSEQLVWPQNAPDASMTITRVTMEPGSVSVRHAHPQSEQIWIVERGSGQLLLDGAQSELNAGDIVRTPAGDIHGVENTGKEPLVYLAITTPPQDFRPAYQQVSAPR
jgi:mannose-6-phosphate isomerase-like protein (cupin superfamily)